MHFFVYSCVFSSDGHFDVISLLFVHCCRIKFLQSNQIEEYVSNNISFCTCTCVNQKNIRKKKIQRS